MSAWPMVALGEVAAVVMGQAPKGDSYNDNNEGMPLIAGASDFDLEAGRPKSKKFTIQPTKVCAPDDIVLGVRATIEVKVVADNAYCLGRGVAGVRASRRLNERYLWHALTHTNNTLLRKARGATFVQVSRADLTSLPIPLPPLAEQRRIAAVLDRADALRRRRREALALLDTLPAALFAEMFGGTANSSMPLGDLIVGSLNNGVSPSKRGKNRARVLTLSAITQGHFDPASAKDDLFDTPPADEKRVAEGDFLICRGNGNPLLVGSGQLATCEGQGFVFPDTMIRAQLNTDRVVPTFFKTAWSRPGVRAQINKVARTTNGTMKVNQANLAKVNIPVPSLSDQRRFEKAMAQCITPLRRAFDVQLAHLDTLFASLQARAFAGEL